VRILLTDVTHSPQMFGLIQDEEHELELPREHQVEDEEELTLSRKSKITVRYINFGSIFDSKTKLAY
jgi:hypothetical protein